MGILPRVDGFKLIYDLLTKQLQVTGAQSSLCQHTEPFSFDFLLENDYT